MLLWKSENIVEKMITDLSTKNLEKITTNSEEEYHNLEKFITLQNGPVIIVGDFGIPSWNLLFKEFLNNTDLSVKNRILFTDGKTSFRFWFVPSLNILGFDNLGIEKISMQNGKFDIRLNY